MNTERKRDDIEQESVAEAMMRHQNGGISLEDRGYMAIWADRVAELVLENYRLRDRLAERDEELSRATKLRDAILENINAAVAKENRCEHEWSVSERNKNDIYCRKCYRRM